MTAATETTRIATAEELAPMTFEGDPGALQIVQGTSGPSNDEWADFLPTIRLCIAALQFDDKELGAKVNDDPEMFLNLLDVAQHVHEKLAGADSLVESAIARLLIVLSRVALSEKDAA